MTTLLAAAVDLLQLIKCKPSFRVGLGCEISYEAIKLAEHIRAKQTSRVLLWVANDDSLWDGLSMPKFHNHMRTQSALCGNLEVCLSETEASWEELKIGDIKAFDEIARHADPEFSWRPKTCFGTGICDKPSSPQGSMVAKRSHSNSVPAPLHIAVQLTTRVKLNGKPC
jgi:hypothetical protein